MFPPDVLPTAAVRDLDADLSMKTHVARTVSACFAVLRQLRSIGRSVPRPVLQKLVVSLVLSRLDYGNATLVGIPMYQLKRLQSVLNATARLVFSSPRRNHVSPLLRQLHWLKAPERIQYKLAVLVYKCLNGMAPSYLADAFLRPEDLTTRTRLRSASSLFIQFALHGCRLSATERFRSLPPVFRTVCRVMSPPLHRCLSTVAS